MANKKTCIFNQHQNNSTSCFGHVYFYFKLQSEKKTSEFIQKGNSSLPFYITYLYKSEFLLDAKIKYIIKLDTISNVKMKLTTIKNKKTVKLKTADGGNDKYV